LLVEFLLGIFGKRTNFCVNYTAPFRTDPVGSPSLEYLSESNEIKGQTTHQVISNLLLTKS